MFRALTAFIAFLAVGATVAPSVAFAQSDPLPSWNDGAVKTSITSFVGRVAKDGGRDFVPPAERIAVFDNDGTLWCEQPIYFQAAFAQRLPAGSTGTAAIYTEHVRITHIIRRVILRQLAILNYVNPF